MGGSPRQKRQRRHEGGDPVAPMKEMGKQHTHDGRDDTAEGVHGKKRKTTRISRTLLTSAERNVAYKVVG